ncbi:hypothetical protein D1646_06340 [Pseudoflavonifractor sp. 60]|uniref:hypothetical protein n=1 Tax=Pseudoflavonifractor sp. 60 TaxID=2304576 RepID=UPI00136F52B9|nr:hypothetical protein [Pseudoflavonifractor sp. 60]NBI66437.1 hypothetical protein [Pseudoflavonifractor sp. 60]
MNLQDNLLELDAAVEKLSQGVNAVGLMSMGLVQTQNPYADSFCMLFNYMVEADRAVHAYLDACFEAM